MASYYVKMKSAKPGKALEHCDYVLRKDSCFCPSKKEELVWCESRNLPVWAGTAEEFFEAADKGERVNAAAYRELEINLPKELPLEKNIELTQKIAQDVLGPRPCVMAIHNKLSAISGEPHPHAHVMYSDRVDDGIARTKETHFSRFNSSQPQKGGARKLTGGKSPGEVFDIARETRKAIGNQINDALQSAGVDARVDHRSLQDRGITRRPEKPLGVKAVKALSPEKREAILDARAASKNP